MKSHIHNIGKPSLRKNKKSVHHTVHTYSDPEDDISSGVESFDEYDMYGSDNGDDIICNGPDFDSLSLVPDSPEINNPEIDNPEIDSPEVDGDDIDSLDIDNPDIDSLAIDSLDIIRQIRSPLCETVSQLLH
jgi:hypothetical protein